MYTDLEKTVPCTCFFGRNEKEKYVQTSDILLPNLLPLLPLHFINSLSSPDKIFCASSWHCFYCSPDVTHSLLGSLVVF